MNTKDFPLLTQILAAETSNPTEALEKKISDLSDKMKEKNKKEGMRQLAICIRHLKKFNEHLAKAREILAKK